jgi:hypothetical protein
VNLTFWADGEVYEFTITSTKENRGSLHKHYRKDKKSIVVESSNFIRGENLGDSDAEKEENINMEVWKTLHRNLDTGPDTLYILYKIII